MRANKRKPFSPFVKYLIVFALGALVCSWTTGSRMWEYWRGEADEQRVETEQAANWQVKAAQETAKRAAEAKLLGRIAQLESELKEARNGKDAGN